MEKRETSDTVGGNVIWQSHYGEQHGGSFKNPKIELPYDPAIPLLGIYPEKTIIPKDTCILMFTAAQFTIARAWKKPQCLSTSNAYRRCGAIHTMDYYTAIKKDEIMPFAATWLDLEILVLSEVSQTEKDRV